MIHLLLAAKCSAACGRALFTALRVIYRLWGWTGVLKAVGTLYLSVGAWKTVRLWRTGIQQFDGMIVPTTDGHYALVRGLHVSGPGTFTITAGPSGRQTVYIRQIRDDEPD